MKKSKSISFLLTTVGLLLFAALYAYSVNIFWNEGTMDLGAHFEWYESLLNSDFSGSILNTPPDYYTPVYAYILVIIKNYTNISSGLHAMKTMTIAFHLISVFFSWRIIYFLTNSLQRSFCGACLVLFAPTAFLNINLVVHFDSIYCALGLASIYFFLRRKPVFGLIAFGIGFTIKGLIIFLLPAIIIYLISEKIRLRYLLTLPACYLLLILPAGFAGKDMLPMIMTYYERGSSWNALTWNAPNVYQFIPSNNFSLFAPLGIFGICVATFLFVFTLFKEKVRFNKRSLLILFLISLVFFPFFLPKMHDRYFFFADILSIVYVFIYPRYFLVPILITCASFIAYLPFVGANYSQFAPLVVPDQTGYFVHKFQYSFQISSLMNLTAIILLIRQFNTEIKNTSNYNIHSIKILLIKTHRDVKEIIKECKSSTTTVMIIGLITTLMLQLNWLMIMKDYGFEKNVLERLTMAILLGGILFTYFWLIYLSLIKVFFKNLSELRKFVFFDSMSMLSFLVTLQVLFKIPLNNMTVLAWLTLFIGIKIILMRPYLYPFLAFAKNLKIYF